MAPSVRSSGSAPWWQAAMAEVERAQTLLDGEDPAALPQVARRLRHGWEHLYCELHRGSEPTHEATAALATLYHAPTLAGDELARQQVFAQGPVVSVDPPALRLGLARELGVLRRAVEEATSARDGSAWVGLVLTFVVLVFMSIAPWVDMFGDDDAAAWRGKYYDNRDLAGRAREHVERRLEFDFNRDSPLRGIGRDDFSVRWDTCLTLDRESEVLFELTSDDGSRLFIDQDQLIDNWGDHGTRTKSASTTLDAGVHHLVVEYYDARFNAELSLLAAFDTDTAESIPVDMLHLPEGDPPCR